MRDQKRRRPDGGGEDPKSELERGREFYRRHAWADAFRALTRADEAGLLGADDLHDLGMCAGLLGRDEDMLKALERAYHAHLSSGEHVRAARSAVWLGLRLDVVREAGRANGWFARAQRLLDRAGGECAEQGYLVLATARRQLVSGEWKAARDRAAEAERIGDRFREADLVALARNLQGQVLLRGGRIEEGLTYLDEAMVAVTSGELSALVTGIVYCSVIHCCQQVYALGRAREWTSALTAWCQRQPEVVFAGNCLVYRAEVLQLHGDWPDAIAEARRASERLSETDAQAAAAACYQEGEVHRLRGEFARAEESYRSASRRGLEPQPGLALLRLAQGRTGTAEAQIRRVLGAARDRLRRTRLLPASIEILLAAGHLEEAREASRELEEIARALDTEVLRAMAEHARGAVALAEGDAQGAVGALRRSLEVWQHVEAPYIAARLRVLVGQACRALGDEEGARLELDAARAVFEELGAAPELERVAALAEGGSPARPHGLTPRELEVLLLVAAGKTNRAIAAELYLSEKTIDRHVSNIFAKLDVPSRAAATAFAYEHKLL